VTKSRRALTRNYSAETLSNFARACGLAAGGGGAAETIRPASIEDYAMLAALGLWAPEADLIDPIFLEARLFPATATNRAPRGEFALRGEIWLQHEAEPSRPLGDIPRCCLSPVRPILWHRGSELEPALPWWPDASCLAALEALQQGLPQQPQMLAALEALAEQGIVVPRSIASADAADCLRTLEAQRASFARDGFVNLGLLLPPGQMAAFRAYWQKLGALDLFPQRGDRRHGSHGEPSSMLLLHLLAPMVQHIVGKPIEAAFSYSWIYGRGTEMARHRDRAESRYTITFLVDYVPAPDGPTPWPLLLWPRDASAPVEIRQSVGDALLFCGEDLKHARPAFTMGERSTSVLLHYVDRGFYTKLF
jgi:hypothetical protein